MEVPGQEDFSNIFFFFFPRFLFFDSCLLIIVSFLILFPLCFSLKLAGRGGVPEFF